MSKLDESTAKNLTNFVKYDLSRGHLTYTNAAIRGLSKGFSADFLSWYGNEESLQIDDRVKYAKMMEELGYAERVKHIERVHTCPKCGGIHKEFRNHKTHEYICGMRGILSVSHVVCRARHFDA